MHIIDFNNCPISDRNGTYGGQAGYKDGVIYNGGYWIVKYPKATKVDMKGKGIISYTSSPLSEYIGSHIFDILGFNVHETLLVERNGRIAVACKDFCKHRGDLTEMRTIKNSGNEMLSEELQIEFHDSKTGEAVNLRELLLHFEKNPIFKDVPGIIENFWDTAIVDVFIDNNDRNNGNRGLLFDEENGRYSIAPVYDNGNSFNNKMTEEKIRERLKEDRKSFVDYACGSRTAYMYGGHVLSAKKFIALNDKGLEAAIKRVVPVIHNKMPVIKDMIMDIPEEYHGLAVCSADRKELYYKYMEERYTHLLYPAYERVLCSEHTQFESVHEKLERKKEISRLLGEMRPDDIGNKSIRRDDRDIL